MVDTILSPCSYIAHGPYNDMQYPSINSVAGSASRNRDAILDGLAPLVDEVSGSSSTTEAGGELGNQERVLEISSGSGEHVVAMSRRWPAVEFWPSERNEEQLKFLSQGIAESTNNATGAPTNNLKPPVKLDVTSESNWSSVPQQLSGVVICNLLHCSPQRIQTDIFSHLGHRGGDHSILKSGGWAAVYGAFMQDDGTFASEGDAKFHQRFTALHPDFGLRKIPDVEAVAQRYGFVLERRIAMPAGNWMLVFRLHGHATEGTDS